MDDVSGYALLQGETELYMNFFKNRLQLELEYVDGLKKLSARTVEMDRRFDEEDKTPERTSWRKAWLNIRANVTEEAKARQAYASRTEHLLQVLTTLRDNKDRMRRRIRDEVRNTVSEYTEYKQSVLRLRKTYERKVEDVREHEESEREHNKSESGGSFPPEHWGGSPAGSDSERERRDSTASSRGGGEKDHHLHPNPQQQNGPSTSTTPLASPPAPGPIEKPPIFVSGATSLPATAGISYRDPPNTSKPNVFDAIAKRDWSGEKSRVNSIVRAVGNLAKGEGGTGQGAHGGLKPSNVRGVRARQAGAKLKREAEQADRDYRNGIFRLETLALQRERVNRSASSSLREFAQELSATLKDIFSQHAGDLVDLGQKTIAIGEHSKPDIANIVPEVDALDFAKRLKDPVPPEAPVYYVNAFVGECRSLLFGVSLSDYHAKFPSRMVPLVVQKCVTAIESFGLESEGIYRIPGKLATVQKLVHQLEKSEEAFNFDPKEEPATIAGVLKLYLRQLPFPLFQYSTADRLAFSYDFDSDQEGHLNALARRIRRLSPPHQATLKYVCEHLWKVVQMQSVNKMTAQNVGLVFGPVVFGEEEGMTLESAMHSAKDIILELLITYNVMLFQGLPAEAAAVARSRAGSGTHVPPRHTSPPSVPTRRPSIPIEPTPTHHRNSSLASQKDLEQSAPRHEQTGAIPPPPVTTMPPPPPPVITSVPQNISSDSLYNLYQDSARALASTHVTPPVHSTERFSGDLSSPSPPLSAAGGRRIPSEESNPGSRKSSGDFPPGSAIFEASQAQRMS